MKSSYYNFSFPYEKEDRLILYNSRSNAMALINKDKYEQFNQFCEFNKEIQDEELVKSLTQGAFLIDDSVNEKELLRFQMLSGRFSTTSLSLTIAPTSDCNFRCIYCYEKDVIDSVYMDEKTEKSIIDLVKLHEKNISYLNVSWYGGEPLMALKTIERLSKQLIEICSENNMNEKIFPHLGKVTDDNDCYHKSDCLSMNEYSIEGFNFNLLTAKHINVLNLYPSLKSCFCGADNINCYVIGADGELYKCWSDIGVQERSVGNINKNYGTANKIFLDYMLYDSTTSELCGECKLLPVCRGGCPFRRLQGVEDKCSIYKYTLENYLKMITVHIRNLHKLQQESKL